MVAGISLTVMLWACRSATREGAPLDQLAPVGADVFGLLWFEANAFGSPTNDRWTPHRAWSDRSSDSCAREIWKGPRNRRRYACASEEKKIAASLKWWIVRCRGADKIRRDVDRGRPDLYPTEPTIVFLRELSTVGTLFQSCRGS